MSNTAEGLPVWAGLDPGVTAGAIALVNWPSFAKAWPLRDLDEAGISDLLRELQSQFDIQFAYVEHVHIMPGDERRHGISKLIEHYGALKSALAAKGIRFETHAAKYWQRRMGCLNRGGDKSISLARAREIFHWIRVTYQVADALLIARLCQLTAPTPDLLSGREVKQKWLSHSKASGRRRRSGSTASAWIRARA